MVTSKGGGWIGVDLDGTLAHYEHFQGADHIGPPIPAMVERVRRWLDEGYDVRVFTARAAISANPWVDEVPIAIAAIKVWCIEHIGIELPITATKDFEMIELWDDRAVAVEANTGRPLSPSTRGLD